MTKSCWLIKLLHLSFCPSHCESQCEQQSLTFLKYQVLEPRMPVLHYNKHYLHNFYCNIYYSDAPTIDISTFLQLCHSHCETKAEMKRLIITSLSKSHVTLRVLIKKVILYKCVQTVSIIPRSGPNSSSVCDSWSVLIWLLRIALFNCRSWENFALYNSRFYDLKHITYTNTIRWSTKLSWGKK